MKKISTPKTRFKTVTPLQTAEAADDHNQTLYDLIFEAAIIAQLRKTMAIALDPALYIVATPIGNLGDITLRALSILSQVDAIYCEDTRHSRKLLTVFGLQKKLNAYHDFSNDFERNAILDRVRNNQSVALISDAGMPLIADPGYKLVRDAIEKELQVYVIPGPSAFITALVSSGFPTDQFYFGGFVPQKDAARVERLTLLSNDTNGTIILYDTPQRMMKTLAALSDICPNRKVAIARELTKLNEEVLIDYPRELIERIGERELKGEIVLLIEPGQALDISDKDIIENLRNQMKLLSVKEAVETVSKGLGASRKKVYNLALKIGDDDGVS